MTLLEVLLEGLFAFDLLLDVLISLQNLVVFNLSQLKALVHAGLKLFLKRVHFVLLLLHQLGLSRKDLFLAGFQVALTLLFLKFICTHLNLMGILIVLLLRQVGLNLS